MPLQDKLSELKNKKTEIEQDLKSIDKETGPQERQKLLDQVKEDNLETSAMEKKIQEIEEKCKILKVENAQLNVELESGQSGIHIYTYKDFTNVIADKNAKYEELLKRDKDMQTFLDAFEKKKKEYGERNFNIERNIENLLEKIRVLAETDSSKMPNRDEMGDLKDNLEFKIKEMKNSKATSDSLVAGNH